MTREQKSELMALLAAGPQAAGHATEMWTSPQVKELIQSRFGIAFHVGYVWQILRDMGWNGASNGKPRLRAPPLDLAPEPTGTMESDFT